MEVLSLRTASALVLFLLVAATAPSAARGRYLYAFGRAAEVGDSDRMELCIHRLSQLGCIRKGMLASRVVEILGEPASWMWDLPTGYVIEFGSAASSRPPLELLFASGLEPDAFPHQGGGTPAGVLTGWEISSIGSW